MNLVRHRGFTSFGQLTTICRDFRHAGTALFHAVERYAYFEKLERSPG